VRSLVRFQPWGISLPHSLMVEQHAVNVMVVGSTPTEAVNFDGRYANGERTAFEAVV
jgi:hypothetical protein